MAPAELNTEDVDGLDHVELVNQYRHFLTQSDVSEVYRTRMGQLAESPVCGTYRLLVDMADLRAYNAELCNRLMRGPVPHMRAAEEAFKGVMVGDFPEKEFRDESAEFKVGFVGSFGAHHVSPRALLSRFLGQLVCLEGIVTKMSVVRPKLVMSAQYCAETNRHHVQHFRDWANLDGLPTNTTLALKDPEDHELDMDYGYSRYKNCQTLTIQEMPERSPTGQLPRSVDVVLEHDLVDAAKPGDRVVVVGLYRAKGLGPNVTTFDTRVIANSVQTIGKEAQGLHMTAKDLLNIRELAKREDVFQFLSRSLAPSIFGHDFIKQALLLLLLGGMEKNLENGTHLRGDINILMVGDPSTAKSQLLRFVLGIAPLAVSTTGRGSTGVGLTAAVTTDPETRERRLEAGAMVLADRGVVCIDEFDKMSDPDRVAIHEVMEQQTVTIAKAGIHASLNARCSVVAAANPIYGMYDKSLTPHRNVNLPDSLLSRFDLLFIVLDNLSPEHDRKISEHILRLHRYQRPGQEGVPFASVSAGADAVGMEDDRESREDMTSPVFQKFNPLLHGGFAAQHNGGASSNSELLHPELIRKYVHYAKSRIKPVLTEEACEFIDNEYAKLRSESEVKSLPVTARQLESFIRLSTAHAKARLSNLVESQDVEQALKIMRYALYHDTQSGAGIAAANARGGAADPNATKLGALSPAPQDPQQQDDEDKWSSESGSESESGSGSGSGSGADDVDEDEDELTAPRPRDGHKRDKRNTRNKRKRASESSSKRRTHHQRQEQDPDGANADPAAGNQSSKSNKKNKTSRTAPASESEDEEVNVDEQSERFKAVVSAFSVLWDETARASRQEVDSIPAQALLDRLRSTARLPGQRISRKELDAILERLELKNRVMYRDGMIIRI